MKKIIAFMLMLALVIHSSFAADPAVKVTEYEMGKEINLISDQPFTKENGHQVLYQAFALAPEVYHYFYVGFMQDKPSSNPNVIPASLASYSLVDIKTVSSAAEENLTYITNPNHPIWLWYRIKSTYAVSIELKFSKIYLDGDKASPHFFYPYLTLYEPDGVTEMKLGEVAYSGRGGWRHTDKGEEPSPGGQVYVPQRVGDYDLYHVVDDSIVMTILDEMDVKSISRGNYLLMKMEARYGGSDFKNIGIGQYKAPIVLTVTVK